jgi:hypothetical protein
VNSRLLGEVITALLTMDLPYLLGSHFEKCVSSSRLDGTGYIIGSIESEQFRCRF